MGTRFIHKGGRIIPIHTDHGDNQSPGPEHASEHPMTPTAQKAPVAGSEANHPAPVAEAPKPEFSAAPTPPASAPIVGKHGQTDAMAHAREVRKFNKAHPIYAGVKKTLGIKPSGG